jgi:predicted dehydrogenase
VVIDTDGPVRWGVVATGGMSRTFVADLLVTPDCQVVAVGSRSTGSARRFADEFGVTRAYGSYEDLAADDDVDVVYVGATHDAHYRAARMGLDAGRAVLCEKPLTVDLDQATELVDTARQRGLFLMEAMWTRCQPGWLSLVEELRAGVIGPILRVEASLGSPAPSDPAHRLRNPSLAGGSLLDTGVYPIAVTVALLGAPADIRALATLDGGVDTSAVLACRWAGGQTGLLGSTIEAVSPGTAVFAGPDGRVILPSPFNKISAYRVEHCGEPARTVSTPLEGAGYVHIAAEVTRCLQAGLIESPLVPLEATLATMAVLDEARRQIGLAYPWETA